MRVYLNYKFGDKVQDQAQPGAAKQLLCCEQSAPQHRCVAGNTSAF